jgi:hypothetical protein
MDGLTESPNGLRLMALRSCKVMLSLRSSLLWPSPTFHNASRRISALRLIPPLIPPTGRNVADSPQLHPISFGTCRRLLHRRSYGCLFPFSSPYVSGFACRTKARLLGNPALPAIPAGLPLRCLQSFVCLRPAPLPCRSDWLRVSRASTRRCPAICFSPFPRSASGTGHSPPYVARFPSRDVVTGLRFSTLPWITPVRLPARNGKLAGSVPPN